MNKKDLIAARDAAIAEAIGKAINEAKNAIDEAIGKAINEAKNAIDDAVARDAAIADARKAIVAAIADAIADAIAAVTDDAIDAMAGADGARDNLELLYKKGMVNIALHILGCPICIPDEEINGPWGRIKKINKKKSDEKT